MLPSPQQVLYLHGIKKNGGWVSEWMDEGVRVQLVPKQKYFRGIMYLELGEGCRQLQCERERKEETPL